MRLMIFILGAVLLIGCLSKKTQTITIDEINGELITDPKDYSVELIKHLDSLYDETITVLKRDEGMNQQEASEFVQYMIDHQLLPTPEISFFDKRGDRQRKELSYKDFRKFAQVILKE